MNVPMQLNVSYILCATFALALAVSLAVSLDILTRAADQTGFFLKAIDILSVRTKELLFLIKCANKLVRA
jgi:hypothetical protein